MKQVVLSKDATKYLAKLPRDSSQRVLRAIRQTAYGKGNPAMTRKLAGRSEWRLRVGNLRVIYEIDHTAGILSVLRIDPRGDVYK